MRRDTDTGTMMLTYKRDVGISQNQIHTNEIKFKKNVQEVSELGRSHNHKYYESYSLSVCMILNGHFIRKNK